MTKHGQYSKTPHKTIQELVIMAKERAKKGELSHVIIQDIVDGYSLGWMSKNHFTIESAVKATI